MKWWKGKGDDAKANEIEAVDHDPSFYDISDWGRYLHNGSSWGKVKSI